MQRLRTLLERLERQRAAQEPPLPYVVEVRDGETVRQAIERTLSGRKPSLGWRCVLAPAPVDLETWERRNIGR